MEPLATVQDVEANYRDLRGQELHNVEAWLRYVSGFLRVRIAGIDTRMAADSSYRDAVVGLIVVAILRRLMSTDPLAGAPYVTLEELEDLTPVLPTVSGTRTFGSIRLGTWASP